MKYIKNFKLLSDIEESDIATYAERRTIFNSIYPLHIFPIKQFEDIEFDDITIFYGGNGSGKSTLLNIIATKLNATRKNKIDKGSYFKYYVDKCNYDMITENPTEIKIITSDDVFDYLLDIRAINTNINRKKEELSKEYLSAKFGSSDNYENYEQLKNIVDSRKQSMSNYIRHRLNNNNIIEQSNGESALMFWEKEITENGIYILDEPENSLSAENQIKLKQFIEESVRFFNCQFIISTHSPFLLKLNESKIYDLDSVPVMTKKWTELENVRIYYEFFKEYEKEFED